MKSINEIRTENLNHIFKTSGRTQAEFGEPLGIGPQQVGQWLNNTPSSETGKPRYIGHASCRKIEQAYGYPENWMDHERQEKNLTEPLRDASLIIEIPVIDLSGQVQEQTTKIVLRDRLFSVGLSTNNALMLEAIDASMSPTINKGSAVLIDTSDIQPKEGGIYLVQDGESLMLKRLIYEYSYLVLDSVWVMKSDNPNKREYPDKFLPQASHARVIGRVVWYDNKLRV